MFASGRRNSQYKSTACSNHCPVCYQPTSSPIFDPFTPSLADLYSQLHALFPHLENITPPTATAEETKPNHEVENDQDDPKLAWPTSREGTLDWDEINRTHDAECIASYLWARSDYGTRASLVFRRQGDDDEGLIWACRRLLVAGMIRATTFDEDEDTWNR
ncbi:hypothetical protein BJ508DRAFT_326296 [Ascobolus immersus RN42]|uniref:Uncharacterized protein n=1 Tax=Ascobolus immersus RN42 TaxID=1160509 RepID=A0A3N4I812_ASCIM|nr:hypothetical protein BJ508DRAFT_326296 [Ascobolus immersus RN42]